MASQVQVCNLALSMVGGGRITSLNDASEAARECGAIFDLLRDEVLEAFPWSFARARKELARDAAPPDFGYAYAYLLPADCLRPLSISEGDGTTDAPYEIEGRLLLTDQEAVHLRYISRVSNPALFTTSFVSCLAARMAVNLAISILKNSQLSLKMFQLYEQMLRSYQLTDARRDVIATDAHEYSPYESAR